jgi:hypothetical protein
MTRMTRMPEIGHERRRGPRRISPCHEPTGLVQEQMIIDRQQRLTPLQASTQNPFASFRERGCE